MSELAFKLCNWSVLPGWGCLVIAPKWPHTKAVVLAGVGINAVAYIAHLVRGKVEDASFFTLKGVRNIFLRGDANTHMACWAHYLAFDVLVGLMEVEDAQRTALPHAAVLPCLGMTLMLGPSGALAYGILRTMFSLRR
eukprot:TRINITY_DN91887_c0_g1_i1.p1 TRINITY_DN91887_c0_g1~~TRINITY_DN91887_c0_g1_i1.p1  ORF type:complete len:138 (-),score=11.17 TRINITY_DN91887_c0_g1_i1:16-429(-)